MGQMMRAEHGGTCRDCGYEIDIDEPVFAAGFGIMWHEDCHEARAHGEAVGPGSAYARHGHDGMDGVWMTDAVAPAWATPAPMRAPRQRQERMPGL